MAEIVQIVIGNVLRPGSGLGEGSDGTNGWTPVFSLVSDGTRRVQQVSDWTGGSGTKPATGRYVGSSGFVTDIAQAVDVRGAQGAQGNQGSTGPKGETGDQGIQGDPGEQGPAGEDGAPGQDGQDGTDGNDGAPGRSIQVFTAEPAGDFNTDYFAGDVVLYE